MAGWLVEHGVTRKEAEVLTALSEGLTNAEIAARLYVSERTVESHVSSLLRKLQVGSRRELARLVHGREDSNRESTLPAGTVTFLLSDIEGSTRWWEASPYGMAVAVPRHYELLHEAIVGHGGVRPVEQGEGDSVVGAFSRASDAVAAAVAAQQALINESWPEGVELGVRIAVHTGDVWLRDEGNYFGPTLNRCARLRAIAHGGQVLVSNSTVEVMPDRLDGGVALVDLGVHRLKDLQRPEHVWQAVHPHLPSVFPSLRSVDVFAHNLPTQLTPLIGRADEISKLCQLVTDHRLVTLTGSGGVGKTRLALAVAAEVLDAKPGGVWWVELAPLSDPDAVGREALASIGAREVFGSTIIHQLAIELGAEPALLVLDNCEHLVGPCATLVAGLLAASPTTSVMATSREPLGVPGEVTWRVPSLASPEPDCVIDIETLTDYDAVVLFAERARRARPSFSLEDVDAVAVAQICRSLDGIPLALELAAARCRQLSVQHIAAQLGNRFLHLTGGARTVMARQQTLSASIDWSHGLLAESERRVFRRLGVFAGPFPPEAALSVVAVGNDVDPAEVLEIVTRLVDKSLVLIDEGPGGAPRYSLLETLRAYAMDRANAADELAALRSAHVAWWADWLEPRGAMPTDDVLEEIEAYHANLKAALDWSVDQQALGLRLLRGVAIAWEDLGRAGDAVDATDRLVTAHNAQRYSAEWLAAADASARLQFLARGPIDYGERLKQIEAVASGLGDEYHRGLARWREERNHDVKAALRDMAQDRGDRYLEARLTIRLAAEVAEEDPVAALPLLMRADAAAATSGMRSLRDLARFAHAEAAAANGDLAETIELATAVLKSTASTNSREAIRALSVAGLLAENEQALRLTVEVSARALRKSPGLALWAHTSRRRLELLEGKPAEVSPNVDDRTWSWPPSAGTLWLECRETIDAGAADAAVRHARTWARLDPHGRAVLAAIEAAATGDEHRWRAALAIALDHGLRLIAVDALEGLATAAANAGNGKECLVGIAAARRLREETGYSWRFAFEHQAVAAARTAAIAAVGNADHESADVEGHNLGWREAAAYALAARGQPEASPRPCLPHPS